MSDSADASGIAESEDVTVTLGPHDAENSYHCSMLFDRPLNKKALMFYSENCNIVGMLSG